MSNIDKQQINRWPGMNAWAFAVVVGLLMAFSIANMERARRARGDDIPMSNIDKQRRAAVRTLEAMGYVFRDEWIAPVPTRKP